MEHFAEKLGLEDKVLEREKDKSELSEFVLLVCVHVFVYIYLCEHILSACTLYDLYRCV